MKKTQRLRGELHWHNHAILGGEKSELKLYGKNTHGTPFEIVLNMPDHLVEEFTRSFYALTEYRIHVALTRKKDFVDAATGQPPF